MAIDKILAKSLKFDDADLTANQRGQLSDRQRLRFDEAARVGRSHRPKVLAIAVFGVGAMLALMATQPSVTKAELGIVVGAGAAFLAVIVLLTTKVGMTPASLEHTEVHVTEGSPTIDTVIRHPGWRHVTVGGVQFSTDSTMAKFFHESATYRIYYASLTRGYHQILSVETVAPAK